jgi:hypothetical protein
MDNFNQINPNKFTINNKINSIYIIYIPILIINLFLQYLNIEFIDIVEYYYFEKISFS